MKTLIEILQELFSATDEQSAAFSDALKTNGIYTTSHENMDVRFPKMKTERDAAVTERDQAHSLIEELKKSNKGNEALQQQVAAFESENAKLKAQLEETQIDADVHVELLSAGVKPDDIDYVMYKLKAKGKLERGEDGKIKDMEDKIAALKTQLPAQFTSAGKKTYQEHKLPDQREDDGDPEPKTLAEALQQYYEPNN